MPLVVIIAHPAAGLDDAQARVAFMLTKHGMRLLDFAKTFGKRQMLIRGDRLVFEKDHQMVEQRRPDLFHRLIIE